MMKKHGSYYSNILIEIIYEQKQKTPPPHIKNINFLKNRVIIGRLLNLGLFHVKIIKKND